MVKLQDADFVCVQELKAHEINMTDEMLETDNLQGYFSYAIKPGYSGVEYIQKKYPLESLIKLILKQWIMKGDILNSF